MSRIVSAGVEPPVGPVNEALTLADICEAIVDCEHKTAPTGTVGIPCIRTTNIKNGRLDLEGANRVSEETFGEWTARMKPRAWDIILAREAPVGEVGIVPPGARVCLGQRTVLLRADSSKVEPRFLLYSLLTSEAKHGLTSRAEGSTVSHLNLSDIRRMPAPRLPPLSDQRIIGTALWDLDEKVAVNHHMNRTLEGMAEALFKSWFVDFDPVRAKDAEKKPRGLQPKTEALFSSRFEASEIGDLPSGWRVVSLLNIAALLSGGTPATSEPAYWNGGIPWVSGKDVSVADGSYLLETERTVTRAGIQNSATQLLPAGTVIVTARGTVGALAVLSRPMCMSQTSYGLKAKAGVGDAYLRFAVQNSVSSLQQQSYGTIFDTVTTKNLRTTRVVLPPAPLLRAFEEVVNPILGRVLSNLCENRTLSSLRDALLPKLLSGEIRLPANGRSRTSA
jgi:type I restriction enzyme S subunit